MTFEKYDDFFGNNGGCLFIQSIILGNLKEENQQLYYGPDNIGYCYCQKNVGNSNSLIDMDGQCYLLNQQGPCGRGQWLVIKDQIPNCEQVPRGCPADGQHVYWSCNDGQTMCPYGRIHSQNNRMKCSRIGSTQPTCGAGAKLIRNGMRTYCGSPKMMDRREPSVNMVLPSAGRICVPPGNVRPIEEEENNILESSETNGEKEEEDLFSDFNQIPIQPCPTGYYRPTADGPCKEIPRSQMIRSNGQCPPGSRRDNRGQCRRMI